MKTTTMRTMALLGGLSLAAGAAPAVENASGSDFLKLCGSPRTLAMGEVSVAVRGDAGGARWNPALLGTLATTQIELSQTFWIFDTGLSQVSAGIVLPSATIGAQLAWLSVAEESGTDATGEDVDLTSSAHFIAAGLGRSFGKLSVGGLARWSYQSLAEGSAWAVSLDVGGLYALDAPRLGGKLEKGDPALALGIAARNLGTPTKYAATGHPLPMEFAAGAGYTILESKTHRLFLGVDLGYSTSSGFLSRYAVEYGLLGHAFLRFGVKTGAAEDVMSLGVGGEYPAGTIRIGLDYALVPFGDLGLVHSAGLRVGF
jgi:hypothetical protein